MVKARTTSLDVNAFKASGLPVKLGKVTAVNNRLYLTVGRNRQELGGIIVEGKQAGALAGKQVPVIQAGKSIVAIGGLRPCYWILCYLPAFAIRHKIEPALREALIQQYVNMKVITPEIGEKLRASSGAPV